MSDPTEQELIAQYLQSNRRREAMLHWQEPSPTTRHSARQARLRVMAEELGMSVAAVDYWFMSTSRSARRFYDQEDL